MVSIGLKWTIKSNTVEQNPGQFKRRSLHHKWFIRQGILGFVWYTKIICYLKNLIFQSLFEFGANKL